MDPLIFYINILLNYARADYIIDFTERFLITDYYNFNKA